MDSPFFKIREFSQGFLAIMPKPAGSGDLHDALLRIQISGATRIISLLSETESKSLGLADEGQVSGELGLEFLSHPITDFGVPDNSSAFVQLVQDTAVSLKSGSAVVAHCKGGVGRSGLFTVSVLMALGFEREAAIAEVSEARGIQVPETDAQRQWLVEHTNVLKMHLN